MSDDQTEYLPRVTGADPGTGARPRSGPDPDVDARAGARTDAVDGGPARPRRRRDARGAGPATGSGAVVDPALGDDLERRASAHAYAPRGGDESVNETQQLPFLDLPDGPDGPDGHEAPAGPHPAAPPPPATGRAPAPAPAPAHRTRASVRAGRSLPPQLPVDEDRDALTGYLDDEPEPPVRAPGQRRNSVLLVGGGVLLCLLAVVLAFQALGGTGRSPRGGEAATPVTAAEPTVATDTVVFQSPSGNIGCTLSSDGARCDIGSRSWEPPPPPPGCEGEWAAGVRVGPDGAGLVCATDSLLGQGETLEYGESLERGTYRCDSSRDGMRCEETVAGIGFTVARAEYTTF
ncbi:hypothetical protein [Thalassiella azotivora]